MKYNLKQAPLHILTNSKHHQSGKLLYEGNYADVDITDPYFLYFRHIKAFMIKKL